MMTLMMSVAMETATVAADSNEVFNDTADKICPINFVRFSTGCYFFCNSNILRTWCEAYLFCHTLNSYSARLVIIESKDEQNAIAAYLRTKHTPAEISASDKAAAIYWIGLSDQLEEGNFIWHDTGKAPTYTYWANKQPDSSRGIEDCVHLWNTLSSSWNDNGCTAKGRFICEAV